MVNHKEILRLKSLGLTHREIVDAAGCGRNTVTRTLSIKGRRCVRRKSSGNPSASMQILDRFCRACPMLQFNKRKQFYHTRIV